MNYRKEYDLKLIGRNLRRLREANGLSVREVSEHLYLGSVQAVYKYERGCGFPQADTLLALMELYGVHDIRELVGEHKEGEAREASPLLLIESHFSVSRGTPCPVARIREPFWAGLRRRPAGPGTASFSLAGMPRLLYNFPAGI